jgi:hypothetical protein
MPKPNKTWNGYWSSAITYAAGNTVYYKNISYSATQASTNKRPDLNLAKYWGLTNVSVTGYTSVISVGDGEGEILRNTSDDTIYLKTIKDGLAIAVTNNPDDVTVEIVPSEIVHQDLSGHGTNTHGDIDNHIANTSNPHAVTKTQVGLGSVDNVQQLPLSYLDTDGTLAANTDSKVASQKAVKTYTASLTSSSAKDYTQAFLLMGS